MSDNKIYFPLFVNLCNKKILIFGGGKIATRRILSLIDFGGDIKVVAKECSKEIIKLANDNLLVLEERYYTKGEIEQPYMVLGATNDSMVNEQIYLECKEKGILVNIASDQRKSDFYFPGLAIDDSIVIGVTASGTDHKKAKKITEQVRKILKGENEI